MRQVWVSRLNRDVSALGFGCASLGSRISPERGRKAVFRALDVGVSWFDVAPPYGDGQAESLLGSLLGARRTDVVICTKFGIARPEVPLYKRLARPLMRSAVEAFPSIRPLISRARPHGHRAPVAPDRIEAMVGESLKRLGTDYVDVLALHEPSPGEAANEATHAAIARLVAKGMVRAVSVAGTPEAIRAGVEAGQPIHMAQFPDSPFDDASPRLRDALRERSPFFVTHGVYGAGVIERMAGLDSRAWGDLGRIGDAVADASRALDSAELLARFAFSNNPDGVVILSMFTLSHIEHNAAIAADAPRSDFAPQLRRIVSQSGV